MKGLKLKVRIIPMPFEDAEFIGKVINYVQIQFFMKDLIEVEKGWYYYGKNGLDAQTCDLLLFQMDNTIIASAVLNDIILFSKLTIEGNNGAYVVNKQSVKIFKPIDKNELQKIIKSFKHFSHTMQKFD